ncbi:hypothetical protein DJ84_02170 [Halorubrum ezzemoulense]|nr:hypothetical protein DJ84_02170 [Halorubrum ezzemoulense]
MRIGQYRTTDEQTPWTGVATDDGVVDLAEADASIPRRDTDEIAAALEAEGKATGMKLTGDWTF